MTGIVSVNVGVHISYKTQMSFLVEMLTFSMGIDSYRYIWCIFYSLVSSNLFSVWQISIGEIWGKES